MSFIAESKFVGILKLSFGNNAMDENIADQVQQDVLINLLGYDVYSALIDDLDVSGEPQTQKYIDLVDGVAAGYTDSSGYKQKMAGIKEMLPYFYYFTYATTRQFTHLTTGIIESDSVNAVQSKQGLYHLAVQAWNAGYLLYVELQNYIDYKNSETADYYENYHTTEYLTKNVFGIK